MSKKNKIRRDSENLLGLDFSAPRALDRKGEDGRSEFGGLDSAATREAIRKASFRNLGSHAGEAEAIRARLLSMLDRIEGVQTPEQKALLDGLMGQRKKAIAVWLEKFPLQVILSEDEMMVRAEKWLQSLPTNVLQGLIEECPESPQLVIVPGGITAPELLKAIDKNKTVPGQQDGKIWSDELWGGVKADGWKIAVTDGKEDRDFDRSIFYVNPEETDERKLIKRPNEQQVAEWEKRFQSEGLGIMPQYGYVPTAAGKLATGKVLDKQNWTAFKRPQGASFLPDAAWYSFRVRLDRDNPSYASNVLRCRPWVEGEM